MCENSYSLSVIRHLVLNGVVLYFSNESFKFQNSFERERDKDINKKRFDKIKFYLNYFKNFNKKIIICLARKQNESNALEHLILKKGHKPIT